MTFHVGQKVVCVADLDDHYGKIPLTVGDIYTVVKIETWEGLNWDGITYLKFDCVEIAESKSPHPTNLYSTNYFRPVVERKTDISIFTKMLTSNKEKVS